MKNLFYFIAGVLFFFNAHHVLAAASNDITAEIQREMLTGDVPVRAIAAARSGSEESRRSLVLKSARTPSLSRALSLYPEGEDAFYKACATDHHLYTQFFESLTGMKANPFAGENILTTDRQVYTSKADSTEPSRITTFFGSFDPQSPPPSLTFLNKLLSLELKLRPSGKGKIDQERKSFLKSAITFAPYFLGELSCYYEKNYAKGLELYKKYKPRTEDEKDLRTLKMAEILLGVFGEFTKFDENPNQALDLLKQIGKKSTFYGHAQLRYAQYLLGFFGNEECQPERALPILDFLTHSHLVDHLAYLTLLDHHLGVYGGEVNEAEAMRAYEGGIIASEGTSTILFFHRRLGESSLGIFDDREPNVPEAIPYLRRAKDEAYPPLYHIYKGHYGEKYANEGEAQRIFDAGCKEEIQLFKVQKAKFLIEEGRTQDAINILEQYNNGVCDYLLGRLYSKQGDFYDPQKALHHFIRVRSFRDSTARALKLYNTMFNAEFPLDAFKRVLRKESTAEEELLKYQRLLQEEAATEDSPVRPPVEEVVIEVVDEIADIVDAPEFLEEVDRIDLDHPVISLNPLIEEGMDKLHHPWKWRKLARFIRALGGVIEDEVITFPGIEEVFNFDRPHPAKDEVNLNKGRYWPILKRFINMRYEILVQEKLTQMDAAAE